MFATRILSTLVLGLTLTACGGDDPPGPTPPTPDRTPPTVVEVAPVTGSTISVARVIRITFSEPMRESALTLGGALAGDGAEVSWPARTTVEIAPTTAWTAGADRPLTVDAADVAGNALQTLTLTYTVDAALDAVPPTATVLPADGATIATAQTIVVTFSESMAVGSLTVGGSLATISDGGVWSQAASANDRLTISPTTAWPEGNRALTIAADDLAGNPLAPLTVSYTIDAGAVVIDAIPPTGVAAPASGSYLSPTSAIVITYDEAMNTASLAVSGTMSGVASDAWNISDQVLTITPASTWADGAGTLIVDASDVAGNPAPTLTLSYTVDGTPPTATATPPSASSLAGSSTITIQFSEAIEPSSLVLGGSLELESDGGTWTDGDTLVIGPDTSWSTATGAGLTIDATDLAGNELTTLSLTYDIDATPPTLLTVSPLTTAILATNAQILVTFSETLNRSSLSVAGTLLAASYTTTFQTATVTDDRLRIAASSTWNVDVGQTLVIDVADLAGNAAATLILTWDVGVVHVRTTSCNAAGPGKQDTPFCTIQQATATTFPEVRVAAGTYSVDVGTPINNTAKRMLGGYATDWSARDPLAHVSNIVGTGSSAGTFAAPVTIGTGGGGGGLNPQIDGFTIQSATSTNAEAIGAGGSAIITNNRVIATGIGVNGISAFGAPGGFRGTIADNRIEVNGSGAGIVVSTGATAECTITGNTIDAVGTNSALALSVTGTAICAIHGNSIFADATSGATGMQLQNASTVRNNVIAVTSNSGSAGIGIFSGAAPLIQNNTIAFANVGIDVTLGTPLLENNILRGSLNATGICIREAAGATSPTAVRNNDFYDCGQYVYVDSTGLGFPFVCSGGISTNCGGGTALTTPAAVSNTDANPVLGIDYSLTASSPVAVTQGGNTITVITDDIAGTPRTTPYSIGAFERDP